MTHGLPVGVSSFVGREQEMDELAGLISKHRMVTLTGSTGIGKTRLALELAATVGDLYTDGARLVELAGIGDPKLVPLSVASALSEREQPGRSLTDTLVSRLRNRQMLLVVDNCEHMVGACATFAETLLQPMPPGRTSAT